jgi:hypothetical protein
MVTPRKTRRRVDVIWVSIQVRQPCIQGSIGQRNALELNRAGDFLAVKNDDIEPAMYLEHHEYQSIKD